MIHHHHPGPIDGLVNAAIAFVILLVLPVFCGYVIFKCLAVFNFLHH